MLLATCKLCGFRFNRATEGRKITVHTLLNLKEHLKQRGIGLTLNYKAKAEEFMSHLITVCEICYSVAIAEYQLIVTERAFAKAQNIPIKDEEAKTGILNKKAPDSVLSTQLFHQWRVLFYFEHLMKSIK